MSTRLEILEMLKDGVITPDEAERRLNDLQQPQFVKETGGKSLFVNISSSDGDRINVALPINFAKAVLGSKSGIIKNATVAKMDIDLEEVFEMIDKGMIGELVNIESADGDVVKITIK